MFRVAKSATSLRRCLTSASAATATPPDAAVLPGRLDKLLKKQLQDLLRHNSLPVSGTKGVLIERLETFAQQSTVAVPTALQELIPSLPTPTPTPTPATPTLTPATPQPDAYPMPTSFVQSTQSYIGEPVTFQPEQLRLVKSKGMTLDLPELLSFNRVAPVLSVTRDAVSTRVGKSEVIFDVTPLVPFTDGAATSSCDGTVVLATVCQESVKPESADVLGFQVDFREKAFALGSIPMAATRREPHLGSDWEVLAGRMIDRSVRPYLPKGLCADVQLNLFALASDPEVNIAVAGINAASMSLMMSPIEFAGPVCAVQIGISREWRLVVNPSADELEECEADLVVAGTEGGVSMIESGALSGSGMSEDVLLEALELARVEITRLCQLQQELADKQSSQSTSSARIMVADQELLALGEEVVGTTLRQLYQHAPDSKKEQSSRLARACGTFLAAVRERQPECDMILARFTYDELERRIQRECLLDGGQRQHGRDHASVRPLSMETDLLPTVHGSAVFQRGDTQSFCVAALDAPALAVRESHRVKGKEEHRRLIAHYEMPAFATGELSGLRLGRRDVGHGALMEKSLTAVMPDVHSFPYTVRLYSTITSSNGSSSMASVCSGSLALMDAGVPISDVVAGISIGLVSEVEDGRLSRSLLLTDLTGVEDHHGDMDFKVSGTRRGVTGVQLDVKLNELHPLGGVPWHLLKDALEQARTARMGILDQMAGTLAQPRASLKSTVPRSARLSFPPRYRGAVVGLNGSHLEEMRRETGANVQLNECELFIMAPSDDVLREAVQTVEKMLPPDPVPGDQFKVSITQVRPWGLSLEPSGWDNVKGINIPWRVERKDITGLLVPIEEIFHEGQELDVSCIENDPTSHALFSTSVAAVRMKAPFMVDEEQRSEALKRSLLLAQVSSQEEDDKPAIPVPEVFSLGERRKLKNQAPAEKVFEDIFSGKGSKTMISRRHMQRTMKDRVKDSIKHNAQLLDKDDQFQQLLASNTKTNSKKSNKSQARRQSQSSKSGKKRSNSGSTNKSSSSPPASTPAPGTASGKVDAADALNRIQELRKKYLSE